MPEWMIEDDLEDAEPAVQAAAVQAAAVQPVQRKYKVVESIAPKRVKAGRRRF